MLYSCRAAFALSPLGVTPYPPEGQAQLPCLSLLTNYCNLLLQFRDFEKQLVVHNRQSNNLPMRPLSWLSPRQFLVQYV